MQFIVTAIAIDPSNLPKAFPEPRTEVIDTDTNVLFKGLTTLWQVEDRYEAFWNRLNASWETDFPKGKERVLVLSVENADPVQPWNPDW